MTVLLGVTGCIGAYNYPCGLIYRQGVRSNLQVDESELDDNGFRKKKDT